jgi:hypothetical protein
MAGTLIGKYTLYIYKIAAFDSEHLHERTLYLFAVFLTTSF